MRQSLALNGDQAGVHANLGNALVALNQCEAALEHFERAKTIDPRLAAAWINHGEPLIALRRFEEAVVSCNRAMELAPSHPVPIFNRAKALEGLAQHEAALADYDQVIGLRPDIAEAHVRRGDTLLQLNRLDQALASYGRALELEPANAAARFSRALLLSRSGLVEEAVVELQALERIAPYHEGTQGLRLHLQMCVGDWSDWSRSLAAVCEAIETGHRAVPPFAFLALSDSPELQLQCAQLQADERVVVSRLARRSEGLRGERPLRVAYLSADFTEHAMAFLLAAVFERHDPKRFETIAVSLRRDDRSEMGRRVRAAFSHVIEVQGLADIDIARRVQAEDIDILVDLMGYTGGCRAGVLAHRAAAVQVSYLGYPGTLGRAGADYIIADDFVIPPPSRRHYSEAVVYLPDCFQANDDSKAPAPERPSRAQLGLPSDAFVWCSFHSSYKINPPLFDIWVSLVTATPGSVLWLYFTDKATERNLRRQAEARGLDPERIVGAGRVPYAEHLARLGHADACLDTWPFNGGTTTSDALWAGVPVITCAGQSFAARMSGSLLRCIGLAETITASLKEYERMALSVALQPDYRGELRQRLARNKRASPLFDSARFCRHLEVAYLHMHERSLRGEPPASFSVPRYVDLEGH
jgi:predicted O-linked N-acetylglucosamine transferase (SPINDLY family)